MLKTIIPLLKYNMSVFNKKKRQKEFENKQFSYFYVSSILVPQG